MTFSVSGYCSETGMVGTAVTTSSIAVGSRCPWARAGVGAVSTQNVTLPSLGPEILDLLEDGMDPEAALNKALKKNGFSEYRQVTVVDTHGRQAHFSGDRTLGTHAVATGRDCVAAGNLLTSTKVVDAIVDRFEALPGDDLPTRLVESLRAGIAAGGEEGPVHSAALLVYGELLWPLVDLRVDWDDEDPVARLQYLWNAYQPQMNDYITRALNPPAAPSYGVPGDK